MKTRTLIPSIAISLLLCLLAGCNVQGLHVIVQNHSTENIFSGVVYYGSGNFNIEKLEPGQTYHALIAPLYIGIMDFRFVDKYGRTHYIDKGPVVGLDYEGEITIEVKNEYKVEFHNDAKETPGTVQ